MDDWLISGTVVIGVGNIILSDDGVGVHAARRLQDDPRLPADVSILDGGTMGLELGPFVSDASRVLILDAVNTGEAPGTLTRMTGRDLLGTPRGRSVHQLGVADLIATLTLASTKPQDIVVLGLQPANTDWGTTLSPDVEAALGGLVEAALAQLQLWQEALDVSLKSHATSLRGQSLGRKLPKACGEGGL
ncbi:MAG: HyaD/HybD family hydrogenase maturation endopeptidase [Terriglobales bacterium]|jgi:hydrogenase maturation protease